MNFSLPDHKIMESYPQNSDSDVYVFLYTILTPIVEESRGGIQSHITMTLEMKLPDGIFFFCKIDKGELVVTVTNISTQHIFVVELYLLSVLLY